MKPAASTTTYTLVCDEPLIVTSRVARRLEQVTGWSTNKFVTTLRRYRTVQIQAGEHTITAEDTLPKEAQQVLNKVRDARRRH